MVNLFEKKNKMKIAQDGKCILTLFEDYNTSSLNGLRVYTREIYFVYEFKKFNYNLITGNVHTK